MIVDFFDSELNIIYGFLFK